MAYRAMARTSFYAACVSVALMGASVAPAAAQSQFQSYFINIQAVRFVIQTDRNPTRAANRLDRLNTRNPDRAVSVLSAMYERDPDATNELLSNYIVRNPEGAAQLIQELRGSGVPVSPT
ncbi:hypothetical protein ABLE93_26155 [Xanthobacter sp. KR7-65]|uniref:hypothetical protein n=1 Tax=Xanthobacter sp. KR7-65 TaxID=3156612 RepID=UPI0032B36F69